MVKIIFACILGLFFISCSSLQLTNDHYNAIDLQIGIPSSFYSNDTTADTTADTGRVIRAISERAAQTRQVGLCWEDSTKDTILFYFKLPNTTTVNLFVLNENYDPIDTLYNNASLSAGSYIIKWKCDKSQDVLLEEFTFERSLKFNIYFYTN